MKVVAIGISVLMLSLIASQWIKDERTITLEELVPSFEQGKGLKPEQVNALVSSQPLTVTTQVEKALPSSLRGLREPSALDISADGLLIINSKIIGLFDFYLAATGEEALSDIAIRVNGHLTNSLPPKAAKQAQRIFENYVQYLNQVTMLKERYQQSASTLESIVMAKQEISDIRSQYFSDQMVESFWGKSDQYEQYMLSVVALNKDKDLTPEQKLYALEHINAQAPLWLITQRAKANKLNEYRQRYKEMEAEGADKVQLNEFAYAQFGDQAAQRLSALQETRDNWEAKLAQYRIQLDTIVEATDSQAVRNQQIVELRDSYFNANERKRVDVLDRKYLAQSQRTL